MKSLDEKFNLTTPIEPDELYEDIDDSNISMLEIYRKSEKYQHLSEKELIELENMKEDENEDYNKIRKNLTKLAELGESSLETLSQVSEMSKEPRAYEVLAKLIQSTKEVNESLYNIHEKRKKMKNLEPAKDPRTEQGSINVDKAVFVGSPKDLLDKNIHKIE